MRLLRIPFFRSERRQSVGLALIFLLLIISDLDFMYTV